MTCGWILTRRAYFSANARSTAGHSTPTCFCGCMWIARKTLMPGFASKGSQRITDGNEAAGRHIFESTACLNCHAIDGTNGTGRFGPDLTHLMSRRTIAAGAAENTPENLRLWIQNPDAIKPGSLMPAMKLSDPDLGRTRASIWKHCTRERELGIRYVIGCHIAIQTMKTAGATVGG